MSDTWSTVFPVHTRVLQGIYAYLAHDSNIHFESFGDFLMSAFLLQCHQRDSSKLVLNGLASAYTLARNVMPCNCALLSLA